MRKLKFCLVIILISTFLLINVTAKETALLGKWSLVCQSPHLKKASIYFYMTIKQKKKKYVVDIERKGGFLLQENIQVNISRNNITFIRKINEWQYNFKLKIVNSKLITGKYGFLVNNNYKGDFSVKAQKLEKPSPVINVNGEWYINNGKNYKLKLIAKGNTLSGVIIKNNKILFKLSGTIYGNEIALLRYGYDWYEIYFTKTNDNGKVFKGKSIYNDKRISNFNISKTIKQKPKKFIPLTVNGWKPLKKSTWGGYIIFEQGRNKIWWLDETGFIHPIEMKRTLLQYKETYLNINIAPLNTNYAWKYKIGLMVDNRNSPIKVKSKLWKAEKGTLKPEQGEIVQEAGSKSVWFIKNNRAFKIINKKVLQKYLTSGNKIANVKKGYINRFQIGPAIY